MMVRTLLRGLRDRGADLARDRDGAVAVIIALTVPAMLVGVAFAVETGLIGVRQSELQGLADASAGAARQIYDSGLSAGQPAAVTEAQRIAVANNQPNAIAGSNVVEGWWNIIDKVHPDKFGPCVDGQVAGKKFCNAIRVTAQMDHQIALGSLLGVSHIPLTQRSTAYKCSNLDYPITRIADDVPPPTLPAIWLSWATPGHDANTSYYYPNPSSHLRNPIIKFWSPTDGDDVSFVLVDKNGVGILQVDTYCRGTFLVIPDGSDWTNNGPYTLTIKQGANNDSLDIIKTQTIQFAFPTTTYNPTGELTQIDKQFLDPAKTHTTQYPTANAGYQSWASESIPTPDRRAVIVY